MPSANVLLGRAFEAYRAGRNEETEAICRKLVALPPHQGQANFLLGMCLRRTGRGAEAADWLKQAAQLQPRSAEVLNALGSAYSDLLDYPRAAECFARAIQINPRYADAHYNMGNACQRLRQFDKALGYYQSALRINPRDHEAWTNLGNFHKQLNQVQPALAAYDRALQLQPDYALAHWNRAIVLLMAGRLPEGFEEMNGAGVWGAPFSPRAPIPSPAGTANRSGRRRCSSTPSRAWVMPSTLSATWGWRARFRAAYFGNARPAQKPVSTSRLRRPRHRLGRNAAAL